MNTTSITILLPKSLREFVEREVAFGRHRNAADYVQALVREAQKRRVRERVEALLLEGLRSPAREMTRSDWESIGG
jgi:antitoxin ParD1/3/4